MDIKTIELKKSILEDNDRDADVLREQLRNENTFYINVMSSPGSGKTTLLVETIRALQERGGSDQKPLVIGVMEADIDSDVDARTILEETGVPAVQLHTGGMCHLDAEMSRQGLREINSPAMDLVFLENVGNLVCPAEFDTGAEMNAVLLSVPEGDDKPLKYPLMFTKADVVLVTKTDAMPAFDFQKERFLKYLRDCNEAAPVFFVSSRSGSGMEEWCTWLAETVCAWLAQNTEE